MDIFASMTDLSRCRAERSGDRLVLENARMRRTFAWDDGRLLGVSVEDLATGQRWEPAKAVSTFALPGEAESATDGTLAVEPVAETSVTPAHLRATIECAFGTLRVRRVFEIYPDAPAIRCRVYLRGRPAAAGWRSAAAGEGVLLNIESLSTEAGGDFKAPQLDHVAWSRPHVAAKAVQFFDITDRRNNLVREHPLVPYRSPMMLRGNILLVRDELADAGLFFVKEAPCSDVQLADPGCDFSITRSEASVVGLGADPADVREDEWLPCYGCVVGVGPADEHALLANLREYQNHLRRLLPDRDEMVLLNTWGDRGQDRRIGHDFAMRELELASKLGVTHFQLDDGWQKGKSSNSATAGGFLTSIWDRQTDYWEPHPERFPGGLEPVIARGRELGVQVCLWYNPSRDEGYHHWERDADQILALHRRFGVRVFKIDGVDIPNKVAEVNLRRMFDKVQHDSRGAVVFNLDVTAMRRFGYHYFAEYGNLFLENRYTDWSNYYPHWTLRNLWQLAKYVPPQRLQIEFLNVARNADRYAADDPLAPRNVPIEYCFAITMMAQPLAWMEAQNLSDEQVARLAPLIKVYREHMREIHAGRIFPIGREPSGAAFTGFGSTTESGGYLLAFNERSEALSSVDYLPLRGDLRLERVIGTLRVESIEHKAGFSMIEFAADQPFAFGLFRYTRV